MGNLRKRTIPAGLRDGIRILPSRLKPVGQDVLHAGFTLETSEGGALNIHTPHPISSDLWVFLARVVSFESVELGWKR